MPKQTIAGRMASICTNATVQTLIAALDVSGRIYCFDRLVAIDLSHAPTTIEIGFVSGVGEYIVHRAAPGAAAISVAVGQAVYVPPGYRPYARFYGATLTDDLEFYWFGYVGDAS